MSITCSLEDVGDAGFNVRVDNIVSTNSHTSEVRVVGNIMFHCRDNTAEQLLREVLGRGGGSLDTLAMLKALKAKLKAPCRTSQGKSVKKGLGLWGVFCPSFSPL